MLLIRNKYLIKITSRLTYVFREGLHVASICKDSINMCPMAVDFLKSNPEYIERDIFKHNKGQRRVPTNLRLNTVHIDWDQIAKEPAAIDLLKDNPTKINWTEFSRNPAAIDMLRENPEKICWPMLSANPAATDLLRNNPDKVDLSVISCFCNPYLFVAENNIQHESQYVKFLSEKIKSEGRRCRYWQYRFDMYDECFKPTSAAKHLTR